MIIAFFGGVACGVALGIFMAAVSIAMMDAIERNEQ